MIRSDISGRGFAEHLSGRWRRHHEISRGKLAHISRRAWAMSSSVMSVLRSFQSPRRLRRGFLVPFLSFRKSTKSSTSWCFSGVKSPVFRGPVVRWSWMPLGRCQFIIRLRDAVAAYLAPSHQPLEACSAEFVLFELCGSWFVRAAAPSRRGLGNFLRSESLRYPLSTFVTTRIPPAFAW